MSTQKVKGCRKAGRNRQWCETYRSLGRREQHKMERVFSYWKRLINKAYRRGQKDCPDAQAEKWLNLNGMSKRVEQHKNFLSAMYS